jgi:hypothetical protein
MRKPSAKFRGYREDLKGFRGTTAAAHPEGFVQIYAEHGIRDFESLHVIQIRVGLIAPER